MAGDAFAAARDAVHDIVGFLEDDLWIWARGCTATVGQWHRFLRGWCSRGRSIKRGGSVGQWVAAIYVGCCIWLYLSLNRRILCDVCRIIVGMLRNDCKTTLSLIRVALSMTKIETTMTRVNIELHEKCSQRSRRRPGREVAPLRL